MAFEAILQQQATPKRWRHATLFASLAVHVVVLSAGVLHSLWQVEEMPMPSLQVRLTRAVPPPPPPPPPPPAARQSASESRPRTRPVEAKSQEVLVPKDRPKEQSKTLAVEEGAFDRGESDSQVGGQAAGVPRGVLGGVVGASPPPPPPAKPNGPKIVSATIGRGQLLIDPNAERYRVKLPLALARSGETYTAMLRLCVSAEGGVTSVQVLKGAGAALDGQFPSVMGRWRYRPLLADGVATPFCYLLRYEVSGR
jgi:protein TonB